MARKQYITITCRVDEDQYDKIYKAVAIKAKQVEIDINLAQFMRHSALKEAKKLIKQGGGGK